VLLNICISEGLNSQSEVVLGGDTSVTLPCESVDGICKFFHLDITGEYFFFFLFFFLFFLSLEYKVLWWGFSY